MNINGTQDWEVISTYTRAQAIEDGVLIDLTDWAKEVGFKYPVACTAAVWSDYIEPPAKCKGLGQDVRGRAHDVLWMMSCAIHRQRGSCDRIDFQTRFLKAPHRYEDVTFKSICGPGDDAEPVITIMLPNED